MLTLAYMTIVGMLESGMLHHLVSQNTDGLHAHTERHPDGKKQRITARKREVRLVFRFGCRIGFVALDGQQLVSRRVRRL